MASEKRKIIVTPPGTARFVWLNKPDQYVADDGTKGKKRFKTQLILQGSTAEKLKAQIDAEIDRAFDAAAKDKPASKVKKWGKSYPYEVVLDDQGEETDKTAFKFTKNAEFMDKDTKEVKQARPPLVVDAKRHPVRDVAVYGGSEIRVGFTMRGYFNAAAEKAGVSLDLEKVQIIKLADRPVTVDRDFDEVEDGWTPSDDHDDSAPDTGDDANSDY